MHPVIINVGSEEAGNFNYHHNNGLIWSLCLRLGQWGLCRGRWSVDVGKYKHHYYSFCPFRQVGLLLHSNVLGIEVQQDYSPC